jgi:hypothetical protein
VQWAKHKDVLHKLNLDLAKDLEYNNTMIHPHFIHIKLDEKEVKLITDTIQAKADPNPFLFTWVTQDGLEELQGPKTVTITLGQDNKP